MAIECVDVVLRGLRNVTPAQKLVALILAEHARRGTDGAAWPSVPTISDLAGTSERQVQRDLRALVAAGWVSAEKVSRGGRPTVYRLNLKRLAESAAAHKAAAARKRGTVTPTSPSSKRQTVTPTSPSALAPTVTSATPNGDTGVTPTVTSATSNGDTHVTQAFKNRLLTGIEPARADAHDAAVVDPALPLLLFEKFKGRKGTPAPEPTAEDLERRKAEQLARLAAHAAARGETL